MMMNRQTGLGRGLGALIPQQQPPSGGPQFQSARMDSSPAPSRDGIRVEMISVSIIDPNPHQPRTHFDHHDLEDLVSSIKEHGVLQPVVVTTKSDGRYELIVGERRLRASKIAGLEKIPALIRSATDQQKMELAVIENVQRADLNPIEEAKAYIRLQDEFGLTQDAVGERVGKSRPQISNIIRLLQLPVEIQQALAEKKISASNARTLLSLSTNQERVQLFEQMLQGNFTVRQTEARVPHRRSRRATTQDPNLSSLEHQFREVLGTKVVIKRDARGEGEVRIAFYNEEDLKQIGQKILGS